jgi:ribosomal protein L18E
MSKKIIFEKNYKDFKRNDIIDLINVLKNIPFEYYMIRSPLSIQKGKLSFNVIDKTKQLSKMKIDTKTYKKYFKTDKDVAVFMNLTNDTILIVPKILKSKKINKNIYLNISTFSRNAPLEQQINLWKEVFKQLKKCHKNKKDCYLNTHGLGIGWLHIRIDETPKHYRKIDI